MAFRIVWLHRKKANRNHKLCIFHETKVKKFERNLEYKLLKIYKNIDVLSLLC